MYRYIAIVAGLIVGVVDAIAFEVWVGWKHGACAAQPLTPDKLHPNFLSLGRSSYCYVGDKVAENLHQFVLDLLVAGAVAVLLLLVSQPWKDFPAD